MTSHNHSASKAPDAMHLDAMHLDARMEALRTAVVAKDGPAIARHLTAIDAALEGENPVVRATGYAHVQLQLGKPLEAAQVLEDLAAVLGEDATTQYQIGCYRREGGDVQGALAAFGRAAGLRPMMVDAWVNLGTLLDAEDRVDAAVAAYRSGVLADPTDVGAWRNLGNGLAALSRFVEAADAYTTGLGLAASDAMLAVLRASAYQALGEIDRANDSVPEALRDSVGTVVEVADPRRGVDLRCRFHVAAADQEHAQEAARRLLAEVDLDPSRDTFPRRAAEGWLARFGTTVLLCDADRVREGRPNRFFDATDLVRAQLRQR